MTKFFDKFSHIKQIRSNFLEQSECNPLGMKIEEIYSPTQARILGKDCIMVGTNNYLGLTMNEDAINASCAATQNAGTGTTGSRVANGSYKGHQALEKQIADYYEKDHCILFTTGYQANVGFISAIAGRDDYILIDADSHASIYDGCKLGDATIIRFKHNDPENLDKKLARLPADANRLVIVEGVYSMLGDLAPIKEFVAVTKKHGAAIMVDEAHSMGIFGENGRGVCEQEGVEDDVDFIIGTFSKSVGTIGGYCVSNHAGLQDLRYAARAYVFTASLPPAIVAAASENLSTIQNTPSLRKALWHNTDRIYYGLQDMGFEIGPDKTPVIGVKMPDIEGGVRAWQILFEQGIYVNMALPPATPAGVCLLRCSICAAHTDAQIDCILVAFQTVYDALYGAQEEEEEASVKKAASA